jgi:hypothetical protein
MEKYGTVRQAKDDNIIRHTRSASNATDKTVRICIFIPFHGKSGYKNVSEYYYYTKTVRISCQVYFNKPYGLHWPPFGSHWCSAYKENPGEPYLTSDIAGPAVVQWLRYRATNRKVAGSSPMDFSLT